MRLSCAATTLILVGCAGCGERQESNLEAVLGCGLDLEGEFSEVRVVVRGDFAPGSDDELVLGADEVGVLPDLDAAARGVTVEGLVGSYVAAVGRTDSLDSDPLYVYFAPPDSMCSVPSTVNSRTPGAMAAGVDGRVLAVGGRFLDGSLADELVEIDLRSGTVHLLDETLPDATDGQSLHAVGGGRYVMLGGAHRGSAWHSGLTIDLDSDSVLAPQASNLLVDGAVRGVAYHGSLEIEDGRIWVIGGCRSIDLSGNCRGDDGEPADVVAETFLVDPEDLQAGESASPLLAARFGATALLGADGVAYVVGGYGPDGQAVATIERGDVEAESWTEVGSTSGEVAGATLMDGGMLVVALADGSLEWFSEEAGSDVLGVGAIAPDLPPVEPGAPHGTHRPLVTLAGERVLVDAYAFMPGTTDPLLTAVTVLPETTPGSSPGQRTGARVLVLGDGTVLMAGGVESGAEGGTIAARPFLLRVRPPLDGSDEVVPDVARPESGAFVSNVPGSSFIADGELIVAGLETSEPQAAGVPEVRAHVRGFRSRNFRLGFQVGGTSGEALPHVTLEVGGRWALAVSLDATQPRVVRREFGVAAEEVACDTTAGTLEGDVDVTLGPEGLRVLTDDGFSVECSLGALGLPAADPAIGVGVSGDGVVIFERLRLTRL